MLFIVTFLLGVGNFALHRAVLDSGHPLLAQAPWLFQALGGRVSLAIEFTMLLTAMLMVAAGSTGWAWFYLGYSAINGLSAWLILSGRV
ncbi:hypothetical protein [Novosphingobium sp.]|jgi:hypothetical protein|uniref:hypothetical protein n=1 Tax=Novosphingobium sp. TaxID=1874826 RepID=UPI00342B33A6